MRYYSAMLGRFINKDPLGYLFGMNPYEYCAGNPGNLVDPFGAGWFTDWLYDTGASFVKGVVEGAVSTVVAVGVVVIAGVTLGPEAALAALATIFVASLVYIAADLSDILTNPNLTPNERWNRFVRLGGQIVGGTLIFRGAKILLPVEIFPADKVPKVFEQLMPEKDPVGSYLREKVETPGGEPGTNKSPVENPAGGSGKCPTSTEVTPEGITQIKQHLNNTPGIEPGEPESAMIARLESGSRTPQDITFYQHELIESGFVKQGLSPREAHLKALETQGIPYDPLVDTKIYHSDVIRQYPDRFNPSAVEAVSK